MSYQAAPGTAFHAAPTSGSAGAIGLVVQFTDDTRYADPSGATWAWDFGDGGTSSEQSPSHAYLVRGTYTVTLTVTRTDGSGLSSTLARTDLIIVAP
jgi:serine protease